MKQFLFSFILTCLLSACTVGSVYRVYQGERLPALAIATLEGSQFLRQDWLNRYTDAVRFAQVDDIAIENSVAYNRLELAPGFHDVTVYFYWDMGSARGMAPALVSYAVSRDSMSRRMRFNARAGEFYRVMAEPHFTGSRQDITTLTHVDFWIVDRDGNEIVTREAGCFIPEVD
ncbi:MAG: hypothetical protein OXE78_11905 [Gammaproteobacteria bacterium]|nr:hypothetical protein [Gammaproteobacteria bacterium]